MALRLGLVLVLFLLALAMAAESSSSPLHWGVTTTTTHFSSPSRGDGLIGDFIDVEEETMMESESARRVLASGRYISYGAMQRNNVPCNRRGNSYYNCNSRGRANPYRRGCNVITKCGRRT
ncbi:unnamed protein product [Ilex paraguariensis]|uniref:Rapid ALkalinization Factor n=1 Tax=Ilex paraguariensis TaxID=185542 RepID=A0ABC8UPJ1_9AQUA